MTSDTAAEPVPTRYVWVYGEINAALGAFLVNEFSRAVTDQIKVVHLVMSSTGGDIAEGIALYNVLGAFPFRVHAHNVGSVDSSAVLIYLAACERFVNPSASFTVHGASVNVPAISMNRSFTDLVSARIDQLNEQVKGILEEETSIPITDDYFLQDRYYSASESESVAIVTHGPKEFVLPADVEIVAPR